MLTSANRRYRSLIYTYTLVLVCVCLLMACTGDPTILTPLEKKLRVHDGESREFHSTLYYPKGLSLHYPGYIIGIQKVDREILRDPSVDTWFPSFLRNDAAYFEGERNLRWGLGTKRLLAKVVDDRKAQFVAHVTRYSQTIANGYAFGDECILYNAFDSPWFYERQVDGAEPDKRNLSKVIHWKRCEGAPDWEGDVLGKNTFYANGEPALKALGAFVARDLGGNGYTHVLLLVMGWNTAQDEAVRNFNDIVGNILEAARETLPARSQGTESAPFRPLVIGVTWPSYWSTGLLNMLSYTNKAHDADELGISWLNLLLNEILPAAIGDEKTPLVVVGHSFGARAVTRAAFSSPALKSQDAATIAPDAATIASKAALIVGLQGAVSINRFGRDAGDEGAPYRDFARLTSTRIVLTASKWDTAAGGPIFWYDPSGSISSYNKACARQAPWHKETFRCMVASDRSGLLSGDRASEPFRICDRDGTGCRTLGQRIDIANDARVLYVDISDEITRYNTLGTGGNAHNDVYRLPMGRLLWTLIQSFVPSRGGH